MRRGGGSFSNKLVHVKGDDGWLVVGRKGQTKNRAPIPTNSKGKAADAVFNVGNDFRFGRLHERLTIPQMQQIRQLVSSNKSTDLSTDLPIFSSVQPLCSATDLQTRFNAIQKTWVASKSRLQLKNLLEAELHLIERNTVNKAICLGLGSLSNDKIRRDSMWQLVVFTDIVSMLPSHCSLTAQDPVFNSVDKEFFQLFNIEIVESPEAFTRIDNQTFVFAPHYSISWWPLQLRTGACPLIVGNSIDKAIERTPDETELLDIFRSTGELDDDFVIHDFHMKEELAHFQKIHAYASFPLEDAQEHAFTDIRIYWQRDEDEEGV